MPKCDFNKASLKFAIQHECSAVDLLHIFRTPFPKKTSSRLLLGFCNVCFHQPCSGLSYRQFFEISKAELFTWCSNSCRL